jgi:hypothetical protein
MRTLKECGAGTVDMDSLGHTVYAKGTPGWEKVGA